MAELLILQGRQYGTKLTTALMYGAQAVALMTRINFVSGSNPGRDINYSD